MLISFHSFRTQENLLKWNSDSLMDSYSSKSCSLSSEIKKACQTYFSTFLWPEGLKHTYKQGITFILLDYQYEINAILSIFSDCNNRYFKDGYISRVFISNSPKWWITTEKAYFLPEKSAILYTVSIIYLSSAEEEIQLVLSLFITIWIYFQQQKNYFGFQNYIYAQNAKIDKIVCLLQE